MRIAIVDDLAAERALLKDRLEQQLHRRNVQADILEYESGETFLEAARKAPFTAAFLDIYMDGMTGMEAAKKLRKTDTDCRIPQPDKYMELKVEGSEIHLRYQDIVYAEHFAHLIYVHTTVQKTLATRQPFKTFIAPLKDDTRFFVCGRGVIVNLEHAKDLEGAAFRMADGSRVFVSQDLLKSARQALMEFLLHNGAAASNSGARRGDSRHAACLLPGKIQLKAAAVKACFVACSAACAALRRRRRGVLCAPRADCADACGADLARSRDLHKNAPDLALEIRNDCVVRLCGICLYQQPFKSDQRRYAGRFAAGAGCAMVLSAGRDLLSGDLLAVCRHRLLSCDAQRAEDGRG